MKRKIIVTTILTMCLLGWIGFKIWIKCEEQKQLANMSENGQNMTINIPTVKVLAAEPDAIKETLRLVGNIQAEEEIAVQPRISGRLTSLLVKEGEPVKIGDLIATIDDETVRLQLQQSEAKITSTKANLNQTEANLAKERLEVERYRELYEKRYVSSWEYENVQHDYLVAKTEVENTKAQLIEEQKDYELLKLQLKQTRISSPVNGYILTKLVTPGMNLTSSSTIVTIAALQPVKLTFRIDQKDAIKINRGMSVVFQTDALAGKSFNGRIDQVAPVYDPTTRTLGLTATLPNQTQELIPGMFGTVEVVIGVKDSVLVVPEEALVSQGNQMGVYVVMRNQTAIFRPVEQGLAADGRVEIVSGLKVKDQVIVIGQNRLRSGQQVQILRERSGDKMRRGGENRSENFEKGGGRRQKRTKAGEAL